MLKLTRKANQSIILQTSDGPIEISISEINKGQVGVGINAPTQVNIIRKELLGKRSKQPQLFELY